MNNDILFFFGEHMDALPIYERLENALLSQVPDVKIKVAKTQITFANKRGFAFVSFNPCRKAKDRPAVWVTISFDLGYRKESPRIDVATEPYPGRWTHHGWWEHPMKSTKNCWAGFRKRQIFLPVSGRRVL